MGGSGEATRRSAVISRCGLYRYSLRREWYAPDEPPRWICFIGLNPSTADGAVDDPTLRRELGFARALGANALVKVNLYAFRATDPKRLLRRIVTHGHRAAVGRRNRELVRAAARLARSAGGLGVIAAWGAVARRCEAHASELAALLGPNLRCLGTTRSGAPRHPLYLPSTARPRRWLPPATGG